MNQSLWRTIDLNCTFTDTKSGIKKDHKLIETVIIIKTKGNTQINHLLPEDDLKHQKCVKEK